MRYLKLVSHQWCRAKLQMLNTCTSNNSLGLVYYLLTVWHSHLNQSHLTFLFCYFRHIERQWHYKYYMYNFPTNCTTDFILRNEMCGNTQVRSLSPVGEWIVDWLIAYITIGILPSMNHCWGYVTDSFSVRSLQIAMAINTWKSQNIIRSRQEKKRILYPTDD